MKNLKVAILGAGNIGKYHVREFARLGTDVVAILGSTKESSTKTAKMLKEEFNVNVNPYYNLEELLRKEDLDMVSICTPPKMHEEQIKQCLKKGLHVMCEKPLVQTDNKDYETAKGLFDLAARKNKILTVNTQWASMINYFKLFGNFNDLKHLSIYMEPGEKGADMLKDHLPHTNSILTRLIPNGKAEEIEFPVKTDEAIIVKFKYANKKMVCEVKYELKFKADRPRQIIFSLNDKSFIREINSGYKQNFVCDDGKSFEIEDPLKVSISRFLGACKRTDYSLVGKKEILENIALAEKIIQEYYSKK